MQRDTQSTTYPLGSALPSFALPATDGSTITDLFLRGAPAALVLFTCNHCPYVKGSEVMLNDTVRRFAARGLKAIAISANDAEQYPEDSFEKMGEKARTMNLPYPYLYDESQAVAKSFDAACTPECYLFDQAGVLVYHGTVNNAPRDPQAVVTNHLENAIRQLLDGEILNPSFVHPLGCSIKWRRE